MFTLAFNYFRRPPLVIQGIYDTEGLPTGEVTSYSLGRPQWNLGRIIYPVTTRGGPGAGGESNHCTGTIELELGLFGWQESASQFICEGS